MYINRIQYYLGLLRSDTKLCTLIKNPKLTVLCVNIDCIQWIAYRTIGLCRRLFMNESYTGVTVRVILPFQSQLFVKEVVDI